MFSSVGYPTRKHAEILHSENNPLRDSLSETPKSGASIINVSTVLGLMTAILGFMLV